MIILAQVLFSNNSHIFENVLNISGYIFIIISSLWGIAWCFILARRLVRRTEFLSTEEKNELALTGVTSAPEHILYESFPLLRYLFILLIGSSVLFASLALSQTLCLFWCHRGVKWIFKSFIPLIIIAAIVAISAILIKSIPFFPVACIASILCEMVSLVKLYIFIKIKA